MTPIFHFKIFGMNELKVRYGLTKKSWISPFSEILDLDSTNLKF